MLKDIDRICRYILILWHTIIFWMQLLCIPRTLIYDHLLINLMSFLHIPTHVISPVLILPQPTTLYQPSLFHPPFIITQFVSLPRYQLHLSIYLTSSYQVYQFHWTISLGYILTPSCILLGLRCNHVKVVSFSITRLKQTLWIFVLQRIFILILIPISLPFHIYFITSIVSIIVNLIHLLLPLVLNQVLIKKLALFLVINHVITVPSLIL